jgi:hypothetical protein
MTIVRILVEIGGKTSRERLAYGEVAKSVQVGCVEICDGVQWADAVHQFTA